MARTSKTILIVTGIAAVVSVAAGIYVMMNPWNPTATQQVVVGIASIIGGILLAGFAKKSWAMVFGLIFFGAYQLGRASGIIENSFLRFLVGLPLVGLGMFAIYKLVELLFPDDKEL